MNNIIKNILTAKDNVTYSLTKLVGVSGSAAMIVEFFRMNSVDFQGLGIGLSAMMAALAAKYYIEGK